MALKTLDHVALWVAHRDKHAAILTEQLGMHVIERTDTFTLVGADAKKGKITLFDAEGPREPGALGSVAIRTRGSDSSLDAPGGLRLDLVHDDGGSEWDLHHVSLRVPDPERAASEFVDLGFEPGDGDAVVVAGDKTVHFVEGGNGGVEKPLLNHLALLVDSYKEHVDNARERGLAYEEVDAANTWAVFVTGPYGIRIEYVEHKPGFALK